jgi:hypothetical protein
MSLIRYFMQTFILAVTAFPVVAGQLSAIQLSANYLGLVEEINNKDDDRGTYQWSYGAPINSLLYTISYYNEAQLTSQWEDISRHKRDGLTFQLWGALAISDQFVVRAGVGPYLFFDTQVSDDNVSYKQTHGVVPIYSLATSYDFNLFSAPSFVQFTVNQTGSKDGFETRSYLLGLGFYFDQQDKETSSVSSSRERKVTFLGGITYENGIDNDFGAAFSVEYSQGLKRHFSWSAAILREDGATNNLERTGIVGILWLKSKLTERSDVGLGVGPAYFSGPTEGAGVITISADYSLSGKWGLCLRLNRIATGDNLESDDMLLGISRKF